MSANTDVVPPTSAYVPGGAAAWAPGTSVLFITFTAAVDCGSYDSVTWVTALTIACLASSPLRSRTRYRNIRNKM